MLTDNYNTAIDNINISSAKFNNSNLQATLLAVSKTRSVEEILTLYDLGVRDFGENQVQELVKKYEVLPKDIRWHMIGHLQRNKVKYIAPFIYCIHSVDSVRLAEEINKQGIKNNRIISILLEVNISHEESKFGINPASLNQFLDDITDLNNILLHGLMTVAPNTEQAEENRTYFKNMFKLYVDIQSKKRDNIDITVLSMGMSKDYTVAIEEGATIVRIGSDLFGDRIYIR